MIAFTIIALYIVLGVLIAAAVCRLRDRSDGSEFKLEHAAVAIAIWPLVFVIMLFAALAQLARKLGGEK